MKRYIAALLLFTVAFTTGCRIDQDYSLCLLDDNLVLIFRLTDDEGHDVLAQKIGTIDVVLFDARDEFVLHRSVTPDMLDPDHAMALTVDPGEYKVVSWANVSVNSRFSALDPGTTFMDSYLETLSGETGSPLYYGPRNEVKTKTEGIPVGGDYSIYDVTIPAFSIAEKEVNFVRAHRNVNVFIQNYEIHPEYDNRHPIVQLSNIPYKYDFYLNTDPARKNYRMLASETIVNQQGNFLLARISSPIADFQDEMTVSVRRGTDDAEIHSLNLKTYVESNLDLIEDLNEISILLRFAGDASVTVSIPTWDEIGVIPI